MFVSLLSWLLAVVHVAAGEPAEAAQQARVLAHVLEPGEARSHSVVLELATRMSVRTGKEEEVRRTSTLVSFRVGSLGLRRASAGATVVELAVRDFRLGVLTKTGPSVVEVMMDDEGMMLRRGDEKPRRVPWSNVPRGRGGEVGELIGRAMSCTIDRRANVLKLAGRMAAWSRVLDSMDLTPLVVPLVPLPAMEVEPGAKWTVKDEARRVQLSRPWGEMEIDTRTEVTLVGFEQHQGATVARLAFVSAATHLKEQSRLKYELSISGTMLLGLDGAVVGGEATVTVVATASAIDAHYELVGTGTLQFNPPGEDALVEGAPE
jgi:hypothetical protein